MNKIIATIQYAVHDKFLKKKKKKKKKDESNEQTK